MGSKYLLYFVKYPESGKVKTRLARSLGFQEAAQVYRNLAEENLSILQTLSGVSLTLAFDPPEAREKMKSWLGGAYEFLPQRGSDLGERLAWAFQTAFDRGAKKVVALGSDTLGLKPSIIEQAYGALGHFDVVLGPAQDGGYYLIGLSRPQADLFRSIPWSTPEVLMKTLGKAREEGLSYYLLQELEDLDEIKEEITHEKS